MPPKDFPLPNEQHSNDAPLKGSEASRTESDIAQTVKLGEQMLGFLGGVIDLAFAEAMLAVRTLPKVAMLWLIMMPIILLTWCSFSVLMAWIVTAVSNEIGFGFLTFFLLQVLLLSVCRWLYVKYLARMTLSNTRDQIDGFIRSIRNEVSRRNKTQE